MVIHHCGRSNLACRIFVPDFVPDLDFFMPDRADPNNIFMWNNKAWDISSETWERHPL
jgi:hypothetical protein